ncbi:Ankrd28 [Acrasis kona]|uniref:Ankrd28 n=1 Tax=Acrasis kona TaxID=1008807 RepID=A0AAW2ZEH7_9EUKA
MIDEGDDVQIEESREIHDEHLLIPLEIFDLITSFVRPLPGYFVLRNVCCPWRTLIDDRINRSVTLDALQLDATCKLFDGFPAELAQDIIQHYPLDKITKLRVEISVHRSTHIEIISFLPNLEKIDLVCSPYQPNSFRVKDEQWYREAIRLLQYILNTTSKPIKIELINVPLYEVELDVIRKYQSSLCDLTVSHSSIQRWKDSVNYLTKVEGYKLDHFFSYQQYAPSPFVASLFLDFPLYSYFMEMNYDISSSEIANHMKHENVTKDYLMDVMKSKDKSWFTDREHDVYLLEAFMWQHDCSLLKHYVTACEGDLKCCNVNPLVWSIEGQTIESAEYVLSHDPQIIFYNQGDGQENLLCTCLKSNCNAIIKKNMFNLLLKHGASLTENDSNGKNAIHFACELRNLKVMENIMSIKGFHDFVVKNEHGVSPLAAFFESKTPPKFLYNRLKDWLTKFLSNFSKKSLQELSVGSLKNGIIHEMVLHTCKDEDLYQDMVPKIKWLVDRGCDINAENGIGQQPIHLLFPLGCYGGKFSKELSDTVLSFISMGADINNDVNGRSIAMFLLLSNLKVVNQLFPKFDFSKKFEDGDNCLHLLFKYHRGFNNPKSLEQNILSKLFKPRKNRTLLSQPNANGISPLSIILSDNLFNNNEFYNANKEVLNSFVNKSVFDNKHILPVDYLLQNNQADSFLFRAYIAVSPPSALLETVDNKTLLHKMVILSCSEQSIRHLVQQVKKNCKKHEFKEYLLRKYAEQSAVDMAAMSVDVQQYLKDQLESS